MKEFLSPMTYPDRIFGNDKKERTRYTSDQLEAAADMLSLPRRETGFYDSFKPLDSDGIHEIKTDIEKLLQTEKYADAWSEN